MSDDYHMKAGTQPEPVTRMPPPPAIPFVTTGYLERLETLAAACDEWYDSAGNDTDAALAEAIENYRSQQ